VTRLAVCGARGRMGRAVARLAAASDDLQLVAGIDRDEHDPGDGRDAGDGRASDGAAPSEFPRIVGLADAAGVLAEVDVIVDFSAPAAVRELCERHAAAQAGCALVTGTTGLGEDVEALLGSVAGRAPVLAAANFSIGVNLLTALVRQVASVLGAERYDLEVVEAHHGRKVDAPSGTALALAAAAAAGRGVSLAHVRRDGRSGETGARPVGEIGLHAVRGGGVPGDHAVLFLGERETVELRHRALDRALFADGALTAARWISGRPPGRYTMAEVLGLE
jgi:4-hydroxy-tetrahydrodipicolinate reductase